MVLQRATTLYPINSTTVDTGGAIDVRALSDTEPGATDGTQTVVNPTQATTSERTFDPATGGVTTVADCHAFQGKGWAIPTAGMDTGNAACVAALFPQTCAFAMSGTASGTGTGNVGVSDIFTAKCSLWKYNTSTNTGTLIGVGQDTTVSFLAALAYGPTAWSKAPGIVISSTVLFAANEVLLLQVGGTVNCAAGLLSAARTFTVLLDVDVSTTGINWTTGSALGLRARCTDSQSRVGVGTGAKALARVRATRTSTGVGTATKTRVRVRSSRTATGVGSGATTRRTRHTRTTTGVGTGTTTRRVRATRTTTGVGTASSTRRTRHTRSATGVGTPTTSRLWTAFREATAVGVGTGTFTRSVIFVRIFEVLGIGTPSGRIGLPIDDLPDGGAAPTIIRRVVRIFED